LPPTISNTLLSLFPWSDARDRVRFLATTRADRNTGLKRVLGMRSIEPDRAEPDAAAFGDFVHAALAAFAPEHCARSACGCVVCSRLPVRL
jgi:hypothetical protein